MTTTDTQPAFRAETSTFLSTAGMPGRFASNFDFQLVNILGAADSGGSAPGECYATAAHIVDGDLASWSTAWADTARRVQDLATDCQKSGHDVSAGEAYLRASTYWRGAGFFLERNDEHRIPFWNNNRECFRAGLRLCNIAGETIAVPYENGKSLPGYFVSSGPGTAPKPTAIIIGGGDMTAEELYFFTGAAAVRRGYNALIVELPGQRGAYYSDPELVFRPDNDVQLRYVVDWALNRADVDPERLSLTG
ncbi:hypothetical protein [uncultured Jatrophihabitans sp.]|uniref:alpha/beta hydrolase family protein n=1 Tax=uncultured Jatrophihabitans sp. TaxID=1610747 RepID=UPI0035CC61CA